MSSTKSNTSTGQRDDRRVDHDGKDFYPGPIDPCLSAMTQKTQFGSRGIEEIKSPVVHDIEASTFRGHLTVWDISRDPDEKWHNTQGMLAHRIPCPVLMTTYDPITALSEDWNTFLAAFFALFHCHATLWSVDIRHANTTQANLMWDCASETPKFCDFDLPNQPSRVRTEAVGLGCPTGCSNAGTWVFMAAELLEDDAMAGEVKRVYRHEVEAFIAVLVWIVCRYHDGKLRDGNPLGHWVQKTYLECNAKRRRTFNQIKAGEFPQPPGLPTDTWSHLRLTLRGMLNHSTAASRVLYDHKDFETLIAIDPALTPPKESPDDYNALRSLPKIFDWSLFKHDAATKFTALMRDRILKPSQVPN